MGEMNNDAIDREPPERSNPIRTETIATLQSTQIVTAGIVSLLGALDARTAPSPQALDDLAAGAFNIVCHVGLILQNFECVIPEAMMVRAARDGFLVAIDGSKQNG